MKTLKYIILSIFILFIISTDVNAQSISPISNYQNSMYQRQIMQLDVGNHNSRSSRNSKNNIRRRNSNHSSSKSSSIMEFIISLLFIGILFFLSLVFGKERRFCWHKKNIAKNIMKLDSNFSEAEFLNYAKQVFLKLNDSWTKRDWEPMRSIESKELFEAHNHQVNEYIQNGTINYIEDISIKNIFISKCYCKDESVYIVVKIKVRLIDYIQDSSSGKIIKGNKTTYWKWGYTLTFKTNTAPYLNNWILCKFNAINL